MLMMMLLREIFRSKKKEQQKMKKSMGKLYLSVWGLEKCLLTIHGTADSAEVLPSVRLRKLR
jgi:hypothetical protein